MYRTQILALAATLSACGTTTEAPNTTVEQTVSGLRPGDNGILPNKPGGPGQPDDEKSEFTFLNPGPYTAVVVGVRQADEDRTDLYEGAEFYYDLTQAPEEDAGIYRLDGFVKMSGVDGKLRGKGSELVEDPKNDCIMVTRMAVQGRAPATEMFQLMVRERVVVEGDDCEFSELGPERSEENFYRLQFKADF
ncbi:MAG TPA: hypothetical protein DFR83_21380 [Deltaproteobacteria bacterium]|nr:hypothetical protein [Deltaproteobacteria bacterium]